MLKNISIIVILVITSLFASTKSSNGETIPPAIPVDPISAIIEAFESYDVVALGEGDHNNVQGHEFRLALINDPKFIDTVDDILVEFGSSANQSLIDDFVNGKDIPQLALSKIWLNTTQPNAVWDSPIYEEFFREVRKINSTLPKEKRLRVLLGDPAINWQTIQSKEDYKKAVKRNSRNTNPANIIKQEVIEKKRKVLAIFGEGHYTRKNIYWLFKDRERAEREFNSPVNTIVALLERDGISVFSIWTETGIELSAVQANVSTWKTPSLAMLKNNQLGIEAYTTFYPFPRWIINKEGEMEKVKTDKVQSPRMQDQFDAILYVGSHSSIKYSKVPQELCNDSNYMKLRLDRMAIFARGGVKRLRAHCDELLKK